MAHHWFLQQYGCLVAKQHPLNSVVSLSPLFHGFPLALLSIHVEMSVVLAMLIKNYVYWQAIQLVIQSTVVPQIDHE